MQFFKTPHIDFISFRKYAFAVSGVLSILGLVAFVQLSRGYGNLGVEFSSGAMVQLSAKETFTVDQVRQALNQALRWGMVHRNVAALVEPPRASWPEMRHLTPEQARAFLDSVSFPLKFFRTPPLLSCRLRGIVGLGQVLKVQMRVNLCR